MFDTDREYNMFLESFEFYKLFSNKEQVIFKNGCRLLHANSNESIYSSNKSRSYIYYLIEGRLTLMKQFHSNQPRISDIVTEKNFFGLGMMGKEREIIETAKSATESVYVKISIKTIQTLMNENNDFSIFMFNQVLNKSIKIESYFENICFSESVKSRVLLFLIDFANKYGENVGDEIMLKLELRHHEIAEYIFTSRQTVTQVLNDLKRENLIYFDREKVLIRDLEKLIRQTH